MRLALMLVAVGLLAGCAAAPARHAPREAPMNEAATYGPSRTIYIH